MSYAAILGTQSGGGGGGCVPSILSGFATNPMYDATGKHILSFTMKTHATHAGAILAQTLQHSVQFEVGSPEGYSATRTVLTKSVPN